MAEKIPPHDTEAEKSVLGAALLSKYALVDAAEIVRAKDFYDAGHKEIFSVMVDLFRESRSVDFITVCDELKKRKLLDKVGGRSYIGSLSSQVPSTANAAEYARIVVEKATMRSLIDTAEDIREKAFSAELAPSEILDLAEKGIFELAQKRQRRDYTPISEVLLENIAMIDKACAAKGAVTGLATGFRELDDITSGLHRSDLIIIAARPAMGKTAFALTIAQNAAARSKATVLIFSLEMSKEQLGQRLISMVSKVELQKLKTGNVEKNDWEAINYALANMSRTNLHIDDTPGISVLEMKNKCRRLKAAKGLDLVIIDYLQLMNAEGKADSRQQEITTLSRYLKLLAREIDCPVIVISQLSRAPELRQDHRPVLSDLRESGSIEQDADIVMFLYRDSYYNKENSGKQICEVNIAKHRNGPTKKIKLAWVERYTKFSDMA